MMTWRVLVGDVREQLRGLPPCSVQCCVTSPPYWGLRDYGTAQWEGGDEACEHVGSVARTAPAGTEKQASNKGAVAVMSGNCKCGARRIDAQIGLEPTPDAYVSTLVEVFREVRRVLRRDGTLWLNLGDSYTGSGKGGNPEEGKQATNKGSQSIGVLYGKTGATARDAALTNVSRRWTAERGLAPKNLVGIPWRVAFALQADGWWLRSDIIWSKPNPMPESVTDRPTKAHEYVFLLTKSARYYYDAEAIAEDSIHAGALITNNNGKNSQLGAYGATRTGFLKPDGVLVAAQRNARSVWSMATEPYPEAHFATFPETLPDRCIRAGTKAGDTVLDPFCGSGTTGQVALRHGCSFIGIELNPAYAELARTRISSATTLFAEEVRA